MKIKNFYPLISRNARVTVKSSGKVIFTGSIREIPDSMDDLAVADFSMNDNGHLTFYVEG